MEEKEFNYINAIPLVDVMLVLLTIALTTSTFIAGGLIKVSLPEGSPTAASTPENTVITIDRQGSIFLDTRPVTLMALRGELISADKEMPVVIRADRDIRFQSFVDVLDAVNSMGFKKVAIWTEKDGKG